MFQLVYFSSATNDFSKQDLVELLAQARDKNCRLNITGMLLYRDGNFMQILEGEEMAVRDLYKTITRDGRHKDPIIVVEKHADTPLFSDWSMGFRNLNDAEIQALPGFSQFMNRRLDADSFKNDPNAVWDMLNLFRKMG